MDIQPATAPAHPKWRDALAGLLIFLAALLIFVESPNKYVGDSKYSLLLSHHLLTRHSLALEAYVPRAPILVRSGSADLNGAMYQMECVNGHLYYYFPPGTSILSLPFVAVLEACGMQFVDADGKYHFGREEKMQGVIASVLMAALAVIFYFTARLLLPAAWSVCLALGGALGTQVWSTASRGLWAHTWGVLLLGWVIYLLLAQETGRRKLRTPLLASVLSWMYFVRPTNSIFIVGVTVYVVLFQRRLFVVYALTGAVWFAAFVTYSWYTFHHVLPSYYQASRLDTAQFTEAFAGNLFSPSRGMLADVPVALFVVYLLARYWRQLASPRLVWLALGVGAGQLVAVSCFSPWFGGVCFGPRYTTELVPWLVLLAVLGTRALLDQPEPVREKGVFARRATLTAGGFLLALSIFMNGRGAAVLSTIRWNHLPVSVDDQPERVWDWRQMQALAGLVRRPWPEDLPKVTNNRLDFGNEAAKPFMSEGWSVSEAQCCWTEATYANLYFGMEDFSPSRLRFNAAVYTFRGKLKKQRLFIDLNGRQIASIVMRYGIPVNYSVPLPKGALQAKNALAFRLPDATSPHAVSSSSDRRPLGMALYWLAFDTAEPASTLPDATAKP